MSSSAIRVPVPPPLAPSLTTLTLLVASVLTLTGSVAAQVLPREIRQQILQSVVQVQAYDAAEDQIVGAGSGSIISPDGYVLTNFHVVEGPDGEPLEWHAILVTDPENPDLEPVFRYWARFVAGDRTYDLAIVKIVEYADETPVPPGTVFPAVTIGDSGVLIPGDPVTVVGYPGISGDTITFTSGIVSGFLGEDLSAGGKQWIKTDAKLARGNSGGAAFDENGLLVGVPTLRTQTQDGSYIEQQDYLRPITLAWPLIQANVPGATRVGGLSGSVSGAANPLAPSGMPSGGLRGGAPAAPATASVAAPLGTPQIENGTLGPDDLALDTGEYLDVYLVAMQAGVPVDVAIASDQIDPYLLILDPADEVVLEVDDSSGAGLNVSERFIPDQDGEYLVVVTSAFGYEEGGYELRIQGGTLLSGDLAPADLEPGDLASGEVAPGAGASGGAGDVRAGRIEAGDEELPSGEYLDTHFFDFEVGTSLVVELTSSEFDPYLAILDPSGALVLEVDDSIEAGLNVAETFVPAVSGRYSVVVTSALPGETGAYELRVAGGGGATPSAGAAGAADGGFAAPLSIGTESGFAGELRLGERMFADLAGASDAWAYHTYRIAVPAGTQVLTIQIAADADLDLFVKYGSEIASYSDDGDWQYRDIEIRNDATLSIRAPQPGTWYVDVAWAVGDPAQVSSYEVRAD